jgi:hypothetical protein
MKNDQWLVFVWILCTLFFVGLGRNDSVGTAWQTKNEIHQLMTRLLQTQDHRPPVILLPGLVSSRMVAWKQKKCKGLDIQVQDLVWLNLQKVLETITYDKHCWMQCMRLLPNATDPDDCKIRPEEGLRAVGELSGTNLFSPSAAVVFNPLIRRLAGLGYDSSSIVAAAYDWRLAPMQLEIRDRFFSSLRRRIEEAVERYQRPALVVAHSMGNTVFLYFCQWLRHRLVTTNDFDDWISTHIWTHVSLAAPLLGAPAALKSIISGHAFGLPVSDSAAKDILLTFPSTHLLSPRLSCNTRSENKRYCCLSSMSS